MNPCEITTAPVAPRACSSSHDGSPLHNWSRCTGLIALLVWHVRFRTEPPETLGISDVQTWRIAHAVRGRADVHGGSVRRRITPVAIHRRRNLSKTRSPRKSRPRALQVRITVCWADGERSLTPLTVTYQAIGISLVRNYFIFLRTDCWAPHHKQSRSEESSTLPSRAQLGRDALIGGIEP